MSGFVYFMFPPSASLAPFVECYWGIRGSAHYHTESVLPNGAIELMVNFGPRQKVVAYGERAVDDAFHRAWVAGIQDQPLVHSSPEGANHIAVRFKAGGAHAFFDLPIDQFTGQVIELADIIGEHSTGLLCDSLAGREDDRQRCQVLEHWLIERRLSVHPYFATVRHAIDLLRGGAHGTPVSELCARLGLSNRHLIKQFRHTVGLAPKTYARVSRFQRVIDSCRGQTVVPWARVAVEHGFSDQSHLIREFRRLALVTPEAFVAARTADESHLIVG